MNMNIKMYGADWCIDCINAKKLLHEKGVAFEYIIITQDEKAAEFIKKINHGKMIIPTLDINGEIYINPGINELINLIQ